MKFQLTRADEPVTIYNSKREARTLQVGDVVDATDDDLLLVRVKSDPRFRQVQVAPPVPPALPVVTVEAPAPKLARKAKGKDDAL